MAVLYSTNVGWLISHELFVKNSYSGSTSSSEEVSYIFKPTLFEIRSPYKVEKDVKTSKSSLDSSTETLQADIDFVRTHFKALVGVLENNTECTTDSNYVAKELSSHFLSESSCYPQNTFKGGNKSENHLVSNVDSELYLIPNNCMFYNYDISEIEKHLKGQVFDLILLDPPWWNKYIRKKRKWNAKEGYKMLNNSDIVKIPMLKLLAKDGLVAVWCTNSPSHMKAVTTEMFPAWGVSYISQWFWIKVTQAGTPVCPFSKPLNKQPFERIIFGARQRTYPNPEGNKILASVPSAIHSHKPPLIQVLQPYLKETPSCLEIFSRYLLPHWTSYGNQVLKLQHISLYTQIKNTEHGKD